MRKLLAILSVAGLMSLLVSSSAFAATDITIGDPAVEETGILVDCATDQNGDIVISGTVEVTAGSGTFDLQLMGNIPGNGLGFQPIAGQIYNIDATAGPGTYTFTFTLAAADAEAYTSFRVDAVSDSSEATVNPAKSRSFNIDECTDLIPEVPAAVLLLLTGGLGAAFFAARRIRSSRHSAMAA